LVEDAFVEFSDHECDHECPREILMRQKFPAEMLFLFLAKVKQRELHDNKRQLPPLCFYHEHEQTEEAMSICRMSRKRKAERLADEVNDELVE
jgi:hypothetical protein